MAIKLTGKWKNLGPDGGTFRILQVGNTGKNGQAVIFWRGKNTKIGWRNVGYGTIDANGNTLSISWADPDGKNRGNHGQTFFEYVDNKNLKKVAGIGHGDFKRM